MSESRKRTGGAEPLLSPGEVADLTGLAPHTLAQWRSDRRGLPYVKVGRLVRYQREDVEAYIAAHVVKVAARE